MRQPKYTKVAITIAALLLAVPAAANAASVTVRVEGEDATLLPETTVTIGDGTSRAKHYGTSTNLDINCANDTATEALEQATQGDWDQEPFIQEILGETHGYSPSSWTIYDEDANGNPHYADWGVCDLHLEDGERLVLQAGTNATDANWRPHSPVLDAPDPVPASGSAGTSFNVAVTKWVVPNTPDSIDPNEPCSNPLDVYPCSASSPTHWLSPLMTSSSASGYTVFVEKIGGGYASSAVSNGSGLASFSVPSGGNYRFKADANGIASGNWSRSPWSAPFCVTGGGHTC